MFKTTQVVQIRLSTLQPIRRPVWIKMHYFSSGTTCFIRTYSNLFKSSVVRTLWIFHLKLRNLLKDWQFKKLLVSQSRTSFMHCKRFVYQWPYITQTSPIPIPAQTPATHFINVNYHNLLIGTSTISNNRKS